jgi:hypoxanthine phosphoribosyltransferase
MEARTEEVLISEEEIQAKVAELGGRITRDYQGRAPLLVCVLKGGLIFLADLVRHIDLPLEVDFMAVSSYGLETQSSGVVRILMDLETNIEGRDVLIVEDIVDTGHTLQYITQNLSTRKPRSLRICTLLDKAPRREAEIPLDYVGFAIPDVFVIGYGLDYRENYRHLPYIAVLKP